MFDCFEHSLILGKLHGYCISMKEKLLSSTIIITSYLNNQKQMVVQVQDKSELTVQIRVPQGSVLGPIL